VRFVFVVKSKISLFRLPFFFCFFSRKRLLVSTHVRYIHMRSQKKKKKKKRVSLWLFQKFLRVFSLRKSAFLFSVVALFRSIDDEEEFEQQSSCFDFDEQI